MRAPTAVAVERQIAATARAGVAGGPPAGSRAGPFRRLLLLHRISSRSNVGGLTHEARPRRDAEPLARSGSAAGRKDQIRRTGGPPTRAGRGRRRAWKDAAPARNGTGRAVPRSRMEAGPGTPTTGVTARVSPRAGSSQQRAASYPGEGEALSQQGAGPPAWSGVAGHTAARARAQGHVPRRLIPRAKAIRLEATRRPASRGAFWRRAQRLPPAKVNRISTHSHRDATQGESAKASPRFPRCGVRGKTRTNGLS